MNYVKIISFFIMIVIFLAGCLNDDSEKQQNSDEIKIDLIEDHFENDDFKLITKSKQYIADKSPNIPNHINKSESKNFVISFDVDENEKYENFKKIVYESKDLDLYYEFQIPK
jgi:hypothetical protein